MDGEDGWMGEKIRAEVRVEGKEARAACGGQIGILDTGIIGGEWWRG